jgi:uncharacterized membrane protein
MQRFGGDEMLKLRTVALFAAVLSTGILTGFFLTYGNTMTPGLATTDDRTFVEAFQGLERTLGTFDDGFNWPVAVSFLGGPILAVTAILLNRQRPIVWWITAALVLLIATIVITQTFNVPLNEGIKAAGDSSPIEAAGVREDFREGWWRAWNLVRSATAGGAFICLTWALVLRAKEPGDDRRALA